jgi:hypothetical protein
LTLFQDRLLDDPYPEDRSYPVYSAVDEALDADLLPRRRFPLLDDVLADELQRLEESASNYPLSSLRDSQRFAEYLDEDLDPEKSLLKSPDYYDFEAKYTQMSTEPLPPYGQRVSLPEEAYLDRSRKLQQRLSHEYQGAESLMSPGMGYQDWERHDPCPSYSRDRGWDSERDQDRGYDREAARAAAPEEPGRARMKPQLSWEQYSQGPTL